MSGKLYPHYGKGQEEVQAGLKVDCYIPEDDTCLDFSDALFIHALKHNKRPHDMKEKDATFPGYGKSVCFYGPVLIMNEVWKRCLR